jgi:hypothetical protein
MGQMFASTSRLDGMEQTTECGRSRYAAVSSHELLQKLCRRTRAMSAQGARQQLRV